MRGLVLFGAGLLTGALFTQTGTAQDRDLTYLQLSRNTFVELIPAGPNQQPGITHFGVEFGSLDAAVAGLRQRAATVGDPGLTPARANFARMNDVGGVQIELMELGPDSMQRKAIESWKP